jgi:hypothetical protein
MKACCQRTSFIVTPETAEWLVVEPPAFHDRDLPQSTEA